VGKHEPGKRKSLIYDLVDDEWIMHNLRLSEGTRWPTTFVTCHLLVPSPTDFEIIIYDLVGSTKLVACNLWVASPTYFEILYDLVGLKTFVACHLWVPSQTYFEILYDRASQ
jgi:hypothetical protein